MLFRQMSFEKMTLANDHRSTSAKLPGVSKTTSNFLPLQEMLDDIASLELKRGEKQI